MPEVSVLMPSYNHAKYISHAIESVLGQTFDDLELIIIDDGSADDSRTIIRDYSEKDSRVRALFHDKNCGIARTFNDCIDNAEGKYVALIASDDLWMEDKLLRQLEILNEDEDLVVWTEGLVIDARGNETGELFTVAHGNPGRNKNGRIVGDLLAGNYICSQSLIVKRENTADIRFSEKLRYLNDYKYVLDLALRYEYRFISTPLVKYRVHGGNTILRDPELWRADDLVVRKELLDKHRKLMSRRVLAKHLFFMGTYSHAQGDRGLARRYMLQAAATYPLRSRYWKGAAKALLAPQR